MKSKLDFFLAAVCIILIPFSTGARIYVFGKGVEYDTEILPFLKGILVKSTYLEFSLSLFLVITGGYFLFANFLYERLASSQRQHWWYKTHRLINYLLLFAPLLLIEGTQSIAPNDRRYSQRFLPMLDDLFGQKYYLRFRLDELEGYVFYYALILNIALLIMVTYYAYKNHPNDTNEEMILDDLE